MNTRMYHINPNTGIPSRCYAKNGRCPYGGTSGVSNHYKTFTEAQAYAQRALERKYRMLPSQVAEYEYELDEIDRLLEEKTNRDSDNIRDFLAMSKSNQAKVIRTTEDNDLLMGVINGEIGDGDWEVIGPALQNENIPYELLEEILFKHAKGFGVETRKWAATNKSLSANDLRKVLQDKSDEVKSLAIANGNLEKEYLDYRANKGTLRSLGSLPDAMIFFDERNEGEVPWADHYRKAVKESEYYKESVVKAEKLFNKYIKPNMDT